MKQSNWKDRAELAGIVAIVLGLGLVAYEIRQNTSVAKTEHIRANFSMWMDLASVEMESDVGRAIVKAVEDPDNLSPEDQIKMNSWLGAVVSIYEYNNQAEQLGVGPSLKDYISGDARYYFASSHARQWFELNKRWISPSVAEEIARGIENSPVPSTWEEIRSNNVESDKR